MARWLLAVSLCVAAWGSGPRLPVPELEINLDLAPEKRFTEVIEHFKEPLMTFLQFLHVESPIVKLIGKEISNRRGPENDEFQAELEGMAAQLNLDVGEIHMIQMLYELNTLMIPLVNLTGGLGSGAADLDAVAGLLGAASPSQHASWQMGFGCTGIIATDKEDGTVYHARNLDFSFAKFLQPLTYTGIFTKKGTEIFRAQTIAGYPSVVTGMRKGPNGYTMEINTRFADHPGANKEMFQNLFKNKRDLSGWTKRKILEQHDNYEDAVQAFSYTPYASTEYNIIAGVRKGVILARTPDGLAYQIQLNESSKDYIIVTNWDYVWHDIRENFDPTEASGEGIFHPRRKAAEKILDSRSGAITPELLFEVINDEGDMSPDTIFQVIMNVETGLWNASLPACHVCGRDSGMLV